MTKRDTIYAVGNQIGVGKESDIYIVADKEGTNLCLKLHRLGRISFRAIKEKRDYMGKRKSASWMYMSRLAAQKEWAFMKVGHPFAPLSLSVFPSLTRCGLCPPPFFLSFQVLHANGFPVPTPIDQSRHCILMELIDAYPLRQIDEHDDPGSLYAKLMALLVRFARAGLIHGDFNEFNILIRREDGEPIVIDFPQMVSTSHREAEWFFNRDVACIRTFFRRRFRYESKVWPRFSRSLLDDSVESFKLDVQVEASGFGKSEAKALEDYMNGLKATGQMDEDEEEDEEDESDDDDEEQQSGEDEGEDGAETRAEEVERLAREARDDSTQEQHDTLPTTNDSPVEEAGLLATGSTVITNSLSSIASSVTDSLASLTDSIATLTTSNTPQPDSSTEQPTIPQELSDSPPAPIRPLPTFALAPSSPTHSVSPSLFSTATRSSRRPPTNADDVRGTVTGDLVKERARTEAKHHARAGISKAGKAKGSEHTTIRHSISLSLSLNIWDQS